MNEYELSAPIRVAGHYSTRRIAFTASGVLTILDLAEIGRAGLRPQACRGSRLLERSLKLKLNTPVQLDGTWDGYWNHTPAFGFRANHPLEETQP